MLSEIHYFEISAIESWVCKHENQLEQRFNEFFIAGWADVIEAEYASEGNDE